MRDIEELLLTPIGASIIEEFLRVLALTPANERSKPVSINIQSKNKCLNELKNPSFAGGEIEAQRDLLDCEKVGLVKIEYRDNHIHRPLRNRKAMIYFNTDFESICRENLGLAIKSVSKEWKEAIDSSTLNDNLKNALLSGRPITIEGKSSKEIIDRIEKYCELRRQEEFIRTASAWMFWGISKVLDSRANLWEHLNIIQSPIKLDVWLPEEKVEKILFIENEQSFEQSKKYLHDFILVYCSGFKGTASRIIDAKYRSLHVDICSLENRENLAYLVDSLDGKKTNSIYFWGDLDYAGIEIFLSLKKIYNDAMLWEEGYNKMISENKQFGHSLNQAKKYGQKKILETGVTYIDKVLIPEIHYKGMIDQESLLFN